MYNLGGQNIKNKLILMPKYILVHCKKVLIQSLKKKKTKQNKTKQNKKTSFSHFRMLKLQQKIKTLSGFSKIRVVIHFYSKI